MDSSFPFPCSYGILRSWTVPVSAYVYTASSSVLSIIGPERFSRREPEISVPGFVFVELPDPRRAMKADADVVKETFGKSVQVKKVFWTLLLSMTGLVQARVVDPVTVQR